jgi:hypothetical protein
VKPYPLVDEIIRPVLRVGMPRAPRSIAPGGTAHVVARRDRREFSFTTREDFDGCRPGVMLSTRMPGSPAGRANTPWAARPSSPATSPGGDAEELESCPRRIKG